MSNPEISILIITHNQKILLERCLDSVLSQRIEVPYEIIVSDDGVDDGTKDYIQQLNGSEQVSGIKNLVEFKYIYCNSDECSPLNLAQRIGWNRLTAYKQARGKYFVNVDADDFLVGTDLYQEEYEMLENHPECSMVQTHLLFMDDGDSIDKVKVGYPFNEKLKTGVVFSLEDVLRYGLRGQHQTYMYRRRPQDDMEEILGCRFDDTNITYYHLQYGSVVFLNITGYVWVQHPNNSSRRYKYDDHKTRLLPLHFATLFKDSKYTFLRLGIRKMWDVIATAPVYPRLSEERRIACSKSPAFICRFYSENRHGIYSWCRYRLIWLLLGMMKHFRLETKAWLDLLYWLMI